MKRFKRKTKSTLKAVLIVLSCLMLAYIFTVSFIPQCKDMYSSKIVIFGLAAMGINIIAIVLAPQDFDYELTLFPKYIIFKDREKESQGLQGSVVCKILKKPRSITIYGENWPAVTCIGYNRKVIEYLGQYDDITFVK